MKTARLTDMKLGWFVGDFSPVVLPTTQFEVACKEYVAGAVEQRHVHRIATELTLIVRGLVRMNGQEFRTGDIIVLEPGEPTDFVVIEDTITVVVKTPSVAGDKYPA
jgi:quercetin dioxygenase-like cupin family protein